MRKILLLILLPFVFASCEKLLMPKKADVNATQIFNEIWTVMDKGYVHFGRKGVRWDTVKVLYKDVFTDTMSTQALFDSAASMLNTMLYDGNVSLNSGFGVSYYRQPNSYVINFRKDILQQRYWKGHEQTGPLIHTVIDSVGYIYYGDFDDKVTDQEMQVVIDRIKSKGGKKGVIIDIRDNSGTDPVNMDAFFDHLGPDTNLGYDYSAFLYEMARKNGPGHEDFDSYKGYFKDKNDNKKFGNRVVILTNRGVFGAGSVFASAAKGFANVRVMGDTTGGGGSMNASYELSNGWILTYPAARLRTGDGYSLDEGILPDTVVYMKKIDEDAGKDTMLEAALAECKKK